MGSSLKKSIVVKIGGSTLGSEDTTLEDVIELQKQGKPVIIIHGGGKIITDWLKKQGIQTTFIQGERVTDAQSLEVVNAVLSGLVNKELVSTLNNMGGRAVGICGADGAMVQGGVDRPEMGYVGRTVKIDTAPLEALVSAGYIPVISPISLYSHNRPEGAPGLLNNNADIIAGELASAISAEKLVFLTDVAGILDRESRLIPELTLKSAGELIASGVASGGMIPKIKACVTAVAAACQASIIDGRKPHALLKEINGSYPGTRVVAK